MNDPTPALDALVEQGVRPRVEYLSGVIARIIGCDPRDERVLRCVASVQAQAVAYFPNPIAARLGFAFEPTPAQIEQGRRPHRDVLDRRRARGRPGDRPSLTRDGATRAVTLKVCRYRPAASSGWVGGAGAKEPPRAGRRARPERDHGLAATHRREGVRKCCGRPWLSLQAR